MKTEAENIYMLRGRGSGVLAAGQCVCQVPAILAATESAVHSCGGRLRGDLGARHQRRRKRSEAGMDGYLASAIRW